MGLNVEWDPDKAAQNERKHGVSFEEAATVLSDPLSTTMPDPDHSAREARMLLFGHARTERFLIAAGGRALDQCTPDDPARAEEL
jgi:uncharacterized protein